MNENLRSKIERRLDELDDEVGRQLLDYLEFLDSKYNYSRRAPSTVQRLAESMGAAQVMDAASRVMEGLAAAGRVVADELTPQASDEADEASDEASDEEAPAESEPSEDASPEEEEKPQDA
jgi:hypothetical protein